MLSNDAKQTGIPFGGVSVHLIMYTSLGNTQGLVIKHDVTHCFGLLGWTM